MKRRRFLCAAAAGAALTTPFAKLGTAHGAPRLTQPDRGRFYTVAHGQTIQDAIDRAIADGCHVDRRALVLVAPGVYTEDLAIYAGVDVAMTQADLRNTKPIYKDRGASLSMEFCKLNVAVIDTTAGTSILPLPGLGLPPPKFA